MSNQYPQQPQQPGWNGPQQPGQPQPWGGPQQGWGAPPQPPKKSSAGKIIGFGCLGFVAVLVLIGIIGAVAGGGSDSKSDKANGSNSVKATTDAPKSQKPAADKGKGEDAEKTDTKPAKKVVTFKVWGTAPAGALGPLDITYGSDSDTRQGRFKNGKFEATLPLNKDAMYYTVNAQLQGSGDINCSVTVDGHTKKGHAAGGYNICDAQLSSGLLGGWD
ncbi:hypothetical protein ACWDCB_27500 [Streptomyces sp. NPDC001178]